MNVVYGVCQIFARATVFNSSLNTDSLAGCRLAHLLGAMGITIRPPDIEAEISFLPTEQGGRRSPAASGYRPNHNFGLSGTLNDAAHEYIGCEAAAPGQTVKANMWFLAPQYQEGRLYGGFTFTVQEGSRIVGNGVVTKVLNAALQRGA